MNLFDLLSSLIIILALIMALGIAWYTEKTKVPPVPTLPWVRKAMLNILKTYCAADAPLNMADLGSGWGGVQALLARQYKQANVTGYEIAPWPYLSAKLRFIFARRIKTLRQDFFAADLSHYDVLICYTHPELMTSFKDKLSTLKAGALVISCAFPIPAYTPIETIKCGRGIVTEIYVYRV